jgi:hypothetical protein
VLQYAFLRLADSPAARGEDHPTVPGIADLAACREQVGHLVLDGGVGGEARSQRAGLSAALIPASAQSRFGAQNPRAPLPLRTGMEAEDAFVVVGVDVVGDLIHLRAQTANLAEAGRARRLIMLINLGPHATGVEADIGAGRSTPPAEAAVRPAYPQPLQALRASPQAPRFQVRTSS